MTNKTVPLFPLPDVILFPGQVLPLHVFEPRYRQMTHDLLDGTGELVIGTVLGDDRQQLADVAPVQKIAGLGRLEKYEPIDDGRFLIVVLGLRRVEVHPQVSDHPYPIAAIHPIADEQMPVDLDLREQLIAELRQKGFNEAIPDSTSVSQLADFVLMLTPMEIGQRYAIFSETNTDGRIQEILQASLSNDTNP
jgi:Lon protease-like protein